MTPALDASTDFERLREPAWSRFHKRHPVYPRERFEDAYAEWWTREIARWADGRPSRPAKPIAFVAEAVHRVLIDEGRAMARGLSRGDEKHGLAVVGFEDLDADPAGDAGGEAHYQLLVHRILDLVRERLTPRELSVFVSSFLYLQPSSVAAATLGLSVPRVKKDRVKIAAKVGEEVWAILGAELDLCEAYDDRRLPAVLELLTVHVDGCPHCRAQLQGVRGTAHAVVGPLELLAVGGAAGGGAAGALDSLLTRVGGWGHRAAEVASSVPPSGRTAAVVGVVAATIGGSVAVERTHPDRTPAAAERAATPERQPARPARQAASTPTAAPPAVTAPAPTATTRPAATARASRRQRRGTRPAPTPAPTRAPVPTSAPAPAPVAPSTGSGAGSEFGFEAG